MGDPGNLLLLEFERFPDQQLIQPPVLAQNERVVEAGDQQNILHPEGHQVLEALEEALGVDDGVGGVGYSHRHAVIGKTTLQSYGAAQPRVALSFSLFA